MCLFSLECAEFHARVELSIKFNKLKILVDEDFAKCVSVTCMGESEYYLPLVSIFS